MGGKRGRGESRRDGGGSQVSASTEGGVNWGGGFRGTLFPTGGGDLLECAVVSERREALRRWWELTFVGAEGE